MDGMKEYPDNHFDLAIVDPPYGIGESGGKDRRGKSKHKKKNWDNEIPSSVYFEQIKRISINQIIWGANCFPMYLDSSMGWICWDKKLDFSDFSDFELAWTSFDRAAKIFRYSKNGGSRTPAALADIIHPTQKPIALYIWLLNNYAKPGDLIIDTHVGSASSLIACEKMDFNYVGYELDEEYYKLACNRINVYRQQIDLFIKKPMPDVEQMEVKL